MTTVKALFVTFLVLCYASVLAEEPQAITLLPEKDLQRETLGINAFGNLPQFGTPSMQFDEIKQVLGLQHYRLLFAWSNEVQGSPGTRPDFSFYDDLIKSLPRGTRAIIVIANLPDWMHQQSNWKRGDPVFTLYRRWIRKVIVRYRRKRKIIGFQIWNEPNDDGNSENFTLNFVDNPEQYIQLVKRTQRLMSRRAKKKTLIGAATTSILQNFPETLEYNQALHQQGLEQYIDSWGIHVYGSSHERFYLGVLDFLQSLTKPILVTETGRQGIFEQTEYLRRLLPFLSEEVPGIQRFYIYRFAEPSDPDTTFGLKNPSTSFPVSDLYIHLRDELP